MIKIDGVEKVYLLDRAEVVALRGVNTEFAAGELTALVGPSGCGKSTLLHIAGLIDEPNKGEVRYDGQPLIGLSDREKTRFRQVTFGFVFQTYHLIPTLTSTENTAVPMLLRGASQRAARARAELCLEMVGLKDYIGRNVRALSGGQRQRVAVARALVNEPRVVFADEPTANLDEASGETVVRLLNDLSTKHNIAVVLATHNAQIAMLADKVVTLKDGSKVSETRRTGT